jgi:formate hydrogenlyase subunit 3/multisubunit Na+/H+ antiporter MnhD subunit
MQYIYSYALVLIVSTMYILCLVYTIGMTQTNFERETRKILTKTNIVPITLLGLIATMGAVCLYVFVIFVQHGRVFP